MRDLHCAGSAAGSWILRACRRMRSVLVGFLILAWSGYCTTAACAQDAPAGWQEGRVLAAELSGQGPPAKAKGNNPPRHNIWWTYCVLSKGVSYTAVLRASPAKAGMKVGSTIRLSLSKNRMIVANPNGKNFVLRVMRQAAGSECK